MGYFMKQNNPTSPLPAGAVSIPPKVDPKDLHDVDGKKLLFRKEELPLVTQHLNNKSYFRKGDAAVRKGDIPHEGQIFAKGTRGFAAMRSKGVDYGIYKSKDKKGGDRNRELGHGAFGRVKLGQKLNDGTWKAMKFQLVYGDKHRNLIIHECNMNEEVGLGEGYVIRDKILKGKSLDEFIKHLEKHKSPDVEALRKEAVRNNGSVIVQEVVSIMQYIPGNTLTEVITPVSRVLLPLNYLKLAIDVVKAYQEQIQGKDATGKMLPNRNKKLIHQDLKPGNIIVDIKSGRVKIIDLGLAKEADNVIKYMGTPRYMAPEIMNKNKPASEQSDVYSLGVILKEVLGFASGTHEAVKRVPDETIREKLRGLIKKMTEDDPKERPNIQQCLDYLFKVSPALAAQAGVLDPQSRIVIPSNTSAENMNREQQEVAHPSGLTDVNKMSWKNAHTSARQEAKEMSSNHAHPSWQRKVNVTPSPENPEKDKAMPLSVRAANPTVAVVAGVTDRMSIGERAKYSKNTEKTDIKPIIPSHHRRNQSPHRS